MKNKKHKEIRYLENLVIEKMVFGGQALAHHNGKAVFVWNALPGEVITARVVRARKGIIEAVAETIHSASPDRIDPRDDHFLSSAPWQIMTHEAEVVYKKQTALENFIKMSGGRDIAVEDIALVEGDRDAGYRNKMEFGFFLDECDVLQLSLFNRGSRYPRPVTTCSIALPALWETAQKVLAVLRQLQISRWDLKYLLVRTTTTGESVVGLFVTNEAFDAQTFLDSITLDKRLTGVHVYYSTPKSPAAVVTKVLGVSGAHELTEVLLGVSLTYGIHSFFQINPPVFEKTLEQIARHIPQDAQVVDFYSGVGSISIPLRNTIQQAILVDSNAEAIEYANKNLEDHNLTEWQRYASEAERITEYITREATLILDPPRAGLHGKVIERILEVLPETIIYLSCNIATQGRDVGLLRGEYDILEMTLYDYFPRTPHVESLVILKKRKPSAMRWLLKKVRG